MEEIPVVGGGWPRPRPTLLVLPIEGEFRAALKLGGLNRLRALADIGEDGDPALRGLLAACRGVKGRRLRRRLIIGKQQKGVVWFR